MRHDFNNNNPKDKRFSSKTNLCTGIGGYMDYPLYPNKWSDCSVEDFTDYFNSLDSWCLDRSMLFVLYQNNVHLSKTHIKLKS